MTPRSLITLPMRPRSATDARSFLRQSICAVHSAAVAESAILLTSEAVANAVQHGAPPVILAVECTGEFLEVRVRDGSPKLPVTRVGEELAERGRGLQLVDMLSDAWGVDSDASSGKEVWFHLNVR